MIVSAPSTAPEALLKSGQLRDALLALTGQVRSRPADAPLRVFLFQLLALTGEWERAENQLKVAGELDAQNAPMVAAYAFALRGERERERVFAGSREPAMEGELSPWQALLTQALQRACDGDPQQAAQLREQAFAQAEAVSGTIDGVGFEWIADADSRIGPCLELIMKDGYRWAPFSHISELRFEAPSDLRDKIWTPVQITWASGGSAVGFVPTRYSGTERGGDSDLTLARRTDWTDSGHEGFVGSGQRMFVTDAGEYPLLDVRTITFNKR
ncbi:virulence protein SciE type [Paraburkholderia edwinii]|uniref:Virulence protein SciE type n=1 Tax=Paraburkholderia edwinii TaxID=2861782 RepID=A0ABX8UVJ2_9BURK|nr:virulence protein SciE type [Paraburkholderia edwinii]